MNEEIKGVYLFFLKGYDKVIRRHMKNGVNHRIAISFIRELRKSGADAFLDKYWIVRKEWPNG